MIVQYFSQSIGIGLSGFDRADDESQEWSGDRGGLDPGEVGDVFVPMIGGRIGSRIPIFTSPTLSPNMEKK